MKPVKYSYVVLLLGSIIFTATLQVVQSDADVEGPSESECRPYIEKALKELETGEPPNEDKEENENEILTIETGDSSQKEQESDTQEVTEIDEKKTESESSEVSDLQTLSDENNTKEEAKELVVSDSKEVFAETNNDETIDETDKSTENINTNKSDETKETNEIITTENADSQPLSNEDDNVDKNESKTSKENEKDETNENIITEHSVGDLSNETDKIEAESIESKNELQSSQDEDQLQDDVTQNPETSEQDSASNEVVETTQDSQKDATIDNQQKSDEEQLEQKEHSSAQFESDNSQKTPETTIIKVHVTSIEEQSKNTKTEMVTETAVSDEANSKNPDESSSETESVPEEDLSLDTEIPCNLRPRDHVEHLLKLDEDSSNVENIMNKVSEITLRELKRLYENAIKPLEILYKYRDLSNRHFGDSEIFSKPLILFMGPWSGGKSSIINYLLDNEYNETSLRTGAEPSPAYFNILMHGSEPEILEGTQLAADFTFSGLQKFGQGLEERLRGLKLPKKLLEKVNIVEIPGILEIRKQVSRVFPFNDACQWFIDRADIIFLVYDPSKLDVGPETEAILDQLKGREHQTRIILNKADQVKPEELMRVQGALIWNISPLMSSAQPPIMYTTSLWSRSYETWAPTRLLQAQERAFLRDLRSAVEKRIENKIASARRFAVRVRNHAKMVDCYLTTYYNHKSVFGNRKQIADTIIEHPQDYHIYEGLSTLTNISRYDLPDPDVYKDFFSLNPLYDFQQLSATCTYFRGCPINKLDIAIAYDLPELIGKHKRLVENALIEFNQSSKMPSS